MPVVTVKIVKGRNAAKKRALAAAVTEALVKTIDVKPEWVTVIIDEYARENWASDGKLHSDKYGHGCGQQGVPRKKTERKKRAAHA